ncbi:MAG: hypothetical protein IKX17_01705, partial [Prevotella sp.]|nr:hypothetical protein [Prevotella sp.]
MRTIRLSLLLWAVSLAAAAQNRAVEQAFRDFLATPGISTSESVIRERDLSKPGNPMKSTCEIWDFTCDASMLSHIKQLSQTMEANSSSEQCYYVKTHTAGRMDWHDILIGDDPSRLVELGRSERSNYTIVNFLDTLETTKSHRFAYALEWIEQNVPFKLKENNGKLLKTPVTEKTYKGKVVITYATMPQAKPQAKNNEIKYIDSIEDDDLEHPFELTEKDINEIKENLSQAKDIVEIKPYLDFFNELIERRRQLESGLIDESKFKRLIKNKALATSHPALTTVTEEDLRNFMAIDIDDLRTIVDLLGEAIK